MVYGGTGEEGLGGGFGGGAPLGFCAPWAVTCQMQSCARAFRDEMLQQAWEWGGPMNWGEEACKWGREAVNGGEGL